MAASMSDRMTLNITGAVVLPGVLPGSAGADDRPRRGRLASRAASRDGRTHRPPPRAPRSTVALERAGRSGRMRNTTSRARRGGGRSRRALLARGPCRPRSYHQNGTPAEHLGSGPRKSSACPIASRIACTTTVARGATASVDSRIRLDWDVGARRGRPVIQGYVYNDSPSGASYAPSWWKHSTLPAR